VTIRRFFILGGAVAALGYFPSPARCAADYGPAKQLHFEGDKSIEKKLDLMTKKLSLTPDQGFRVKQALEEQATKLDLLKREIQEARQKIYDDTNGVFMGILNPAQQESYLKIKSDVLGRADGPEGQNRWDGRDPR